jgi:TolB-like protein/Tfp pilus assembly protein PilF
MPVPARLGRYEILAPLGTGGMGEVYRARDTRLGRDIAIKLLPADLARDPERLARIEREARIVAALNHPNIVTLHSVEDEDGVRFLTMELVEGRSLAAELAAGPLPMDVVVATGAAIADALAAAHERGIVHRDLKPANVMRTRDGRVKVLDFGIARSASAPGGATTVTGEAIGTVPYMAPEQLRGGAIDARADLFALGVLLHELATGRHPFAGAASAEIITAILRDAPEPITRLRPDAPPALVRIVARCLEKDPGARVQAAHEVAAALRTPGTARAGSEATIAVLAFANHSADAGDEYFSDGLADELLSMLGKIRGVRVAGRTSSFHWKGKDAPAQDIGRALGVGSLLEGSVRKAGNRVRISVRLVRADDGFQMWSGTYDRTLDDIFAVQDDIAQSVVRELRAALLGEDAGTDRVEAEVSAAARGRGADAEAHRLYLLARHLLDRDQPGDVERAITHLRDALDRDPAFALAWSLLGAAHTREADKAMVPAEEGYAKARAAVDRALALAPDLAEAHAHKGWIQRTHDWDWTGAEASFDRALALEPNNAIVLRRAGALASSLGRSEQAIALTGRALARDPLNAHAWSNLGLFRNDEGQFSEAEAAFRRSLELAPGKAGVHAQLALALHESGRTDEARFEAARETDPSTRLWIEAILADATGDTAAGEAACAALLASEDPACLALAELCSRRGDIDDAFAWLARAVDAREPAVSEMRSLIGFRPLHDDPRWPALLRRIGLPESIRTGTLPLG